MLPTFCCPLYSWRYHCLSFARLWSSLKSLRFAAAVSGVGFGATSAASSFAIEAPCLFSVAPLPDMVAKINDDDKKKKKKKKKKRVNWKTQKQKRGHFCRNVRGAGRVGTRMGSKPSSSNNNNNNNNNKKKEQQQEEEEEEEEEELCLFARLFVLCLFDPGKNKRKDDDDDGRRNGMTGVMSRK